MCAKYSEKDGALSSEMRLNYCEDSRKGAENKLRQYALIREMNKYYNSSVIIWLGGFHNAESYDLSIFS